MTWDEQHRAWRLAREAPDGRADEQRVLVDTRRAMRGGGPLDTEEGWRWLEAAPLDRGRACFLATVCKGQQPSKRLARILVRAGVLERDPSANRWFIEPAVRTLGAERVLEALLGYLRTGTDAEKAGAASARHWVKGSEAFRSGPVATTFREAMLREFVANPDLDVRRRILPGLSLRPEDYPLEVRPLIEQAVTLARAHPDEYIRHRVEVQLGAGEPFKPIPGAHQS
jgi:hypothetical protein